MLHTCFFFFVLSPALESRVRVGPGVRVRVRVRVKMRVIGILFSAPPPLPSLTTITCSIKLVNFVKLIWKEKEDFASGEG
jgi:hypothetical protein